MATASLIPTSERNQVNSVSAYQQTAELNALSALSTAGRAVNWLQAADMLAHNQVGAGQRLELMLQMRQALAPESPALSQAQLLLASDLAGYLSDWPLLASICGKLLEINQGGSKTNLNPSGTETLNINELCIKQSYCLEQMGLYSEALAVLENQLLARPFDPELITNYEYCKSQRQQLPFALTDLQDDPLMLLPLSEQHLENFSWQYADSRIRKLCNLPKFTSNEQWLQWLNSCRQERGLYLFAVMHIEWGFIGSVSLEVYQGVGFFYYWLGADFQGQGYGPKAVARLLALAQRYFAQDCCYAKVYHHNVPSQKAMAKLGFTPLNFEIKPPFANETFYYLGPEKSQWDLYRELNWLLQAQDSELELEEKYFAPCK
ncbi:GNAT family N-acetyltransferase [Thalassomonas actiniarum]|uniref:GNAT family N-acetyltransferase n=1 Tax=Thalassomonas actiniarum TaxID=485447 RepID=A0AAE9YUW3_9GAMM|nr:GNAT family N-acetyltransferase [Thalassomonas actiniarum]WDE01675.1 GNAT family N-acetyltransferase [Thalassomonas actiniarum]